MCVLVASDSAMMTLEEMNNGIHNNSDGCGWAAVTTSGELLVRKALDGRAISAELIDLWDDGVIVAWMWHARLATHGSVKVENCHPFVSPDGLSAMAHNGIFSLNVPAGRVDSEFYASEVLWKLPVDDLVCTGPVYETLDTFVTEHYSKVAIVSANAAYPLAIYNEKAGNWRNGVWYSNASCQSRNVYTRPVSRGMYSVPAWTPVDDDVVTDCQWWESQTADLCGVCTKGLDVWGFCQSCQSCGVCGSAKCEGCLYAYECADCGASGDSACVCLCGHCGAYGEDCICVIPSDALEPVEVF